jgi:hypothetical protein
MSDLDDIELTWKTDSQFPNDPRLVNIKNYTTCINEKFSGRTGTIKSGDIINEFRQFEKEFFTSEYGAGTRPMLLSLEPRFPHIARQMMFITTFTK